MAILMIQVYKCSVAAATLHLYMVNRTLLVEVGGAKGNINFVSY